MGSPTTWRPRGRVRCSSPVQRHLLLGFLDLPLASTFTQLLLGFERWGGSGGGGGGVMVVLVRRAQRGTEQQVANPGLDEGEGGEVRVPGGHHHLRGQEDRDVAPRRIEGRPSATLSSTLSSPCWWPWRGWRRGWGCSWTLAASEPPATWRGWRRTDWLWLDCGGKETKVSNNVTKPTCRDCSRVCYTVTAQGLTPRGRALTMTCWGSRWSRASTHHAAAAQSWTWEPLQILNTKIDGRRNQDKRACVSRQCSYSASFRNRDACRASVLQLQPSRAAARRAFIYYSVSAERHSVRLCLNHYTTDTQVGS